MDANNIVKGMGVIRIVTGLLMAYHGLEVFSPEKMNMYMEWDSIRQLPLGKVLLFFGKGGELVTGILLVLGWFTRISALVMALIMLFICFFIGNGRFWYEDQHPFLFGLIATIFAVYGPGAWALDNLKKKQP
jgi:putative oxidoreductase